jgi:hypothetical protein
MQAPSHKMDVQSLMSFLSSRKRREDKTLEYYHNEFVHIASFKTSYKSMFESPPRVFTGITELDYIVRHQTTKERLKQVGGR